MQSNAEAHWKTTMHAKELPPMYFCNLSLLHSLCVCVWVRLTCSHWVCARAAN